VSYILENGAANVIRSATKIRTGLTAGEINPQYRAHGEIFFRSRDPRLLRAGMEHSAGTTLTPTLP
jgi:hypothetical protein